MRALTLLLLTAAALLAQTKSGEELFTQTCGSAYCHGARATGAGAPRLTGRGFDQTYITNTITRGVTGTAMPAFGTSLPRPELNAIVAYVASLNGITIAETPATTAPPAPALSAEAARGRDLFSETLRGFNRCSTCHELGGLGIPVATPIRTVPADVATLRGLATPNVKTAKLDQRTFPALRISDSSKGSLLFDLSSLPPVQRNALPGTVTWTDGSPWKHASALGGYTDADLAAILSYLKGELKQ